MRDTGSCLCGQLTYSLTRENVISAHHCHCRDCQRVTGSGRATILIVPTDDFDYRGEASRFRVIGADGGHVWREFCPTCGSQVFSHMEETPHLRFVKAGSLDDSSWVAPVSSFWTSTAEPWSPADPGLPGTERNPVL